jgi:hypothetical protein
MFYPTTAEDGSRQVGSEAAMFFSVFRIHSHVLFDFVLPKSCNVTTKGLGTFSMSIRKSHVFSSSTGDDGSHQVGSEVANCIRLL